MLAAEAFALVSYIVSMFVIREVFGKFDYFRDYFYMVHVVLTTKGLEYIWRG